MGVKSKSSLEVGCPYLTEPSQLTKQTPPVPDA